MSAEVVLVQEFPDLARAYQVSSVPLTVIEPVSATAVGGQGTSVLGARPESAFLEAVVEAGRGAGAGTDTALEDTE